jgi:hypothetical protein
MNRRFGARHRIIPRQTRFDSQQQRHGEINRPSNINRTNSVKDQGYGKRQVKGLSDSQCRRLGESQAIGSCIRKGRDSEGNGRQHLGGSKNQEAPPKVDIYVSR